MDQAMAHVEQVSQMLAQINTAAHEQALGVRQISDAVQHMDNITQENTSVVSQMDVAAKRMSVQASEARNNIRVFRLSGQDKTHAETDAVGELMRDICRREGIAPGQVVLHSDNGSPMKGATMLATLRELGVASSFSRPAVSNDNPYSEALFRTLKYRPRYPRKPFTSLLAARAWVGEFVRWYNTEHRHSAIGFVTPEQRHDGRDRDLLERRHALYQAAREKHPERWSGKTRNWTRVEEVFLNPQKGHASCDKRNSGIKRAA